MLGLALLLSTEAVLKLVLPSYLPCENPLRAQERAMSLREKGKINKSDHQLYRYMGK